jgi:hypothetical protein
MALQLLAEAAQAIGAGGLEGRQRHRALQRLVGTVGIEKGAFPRVLEDFSHRSLSAPDAGSALGQA